jgi:hypothetical protein
MTGSEVTLNNIADNFFHCRETPLWFPSNVQLNSLRVCQTCIVRLYAAQPSQSMQALKPIPQGFELEEHTLTTLVFNGINYSLLEAYLVMPGAHRLPGKSAPEVAELCLVFRAALLIKPDFRCICLPIQIGSGVGNDYFSELGNPNKFPRKQTLESLFNSSSQMYQYLGSDFIHKTTNECLNTNKITYMVSTVPVNILQSDFNRIQALNTLPQTQRKTWSPSSGAATQSRIQNLAIIIPSVKLGKKDEPASSKTGTGNVRVQLPDTVKTSQMKCRPLDEKKDIRDGTIYIGGEKRPGDTTLEDELQNAANLSKTWEETGASVQPGDIENAVGGILGIGIALFLVALISWIVMAFVFRGYKVKVKELYDKTKNPVVGILLTISDFTGSVTGKVKNLFCKDK